MKYQCMKLHTILQIENQLYFKKKKKIRTLKNRVEHYSFLSYIGIFYNGIGSKDVPALVFCQLQKV